MTLDVSKHQPSARNSDGPRAWGLYALAGKRVIDVVVSACALLLLCPLLLVISALIKLTSPGPVFYSQNRVGLNGRLFKIVKFRSMVVGADGAGPGITASGDPRITELGARLRRFKLDELPQLWNVFKGDMSLVGPRPELPLYVESYDSSQQKVVTVRPGLTDRASIDFRWEEELLAQCADPQQFYREKVLPRKLALNLEYIEKISLKSDMLLIVGTVRSLVSAPTHKNVLP